jgi:ATP-dependent helicase/DNAse subunit B
MPQQRLFVSDSFPVLQNALVTAVQTLKAADPLLPVTILVPHQFLASHLQRAVAQAGSGYLALQFVTLSDFTKEIADPLLLREGSRPLSPLAAPLVMKKLLTEAGSQNYFSVLATQPGFLRHVVTTLHEFKHARISPHALQTFLGQARPTGVYQQRVKSLQELYARYAQFLTAHRLHDEADVLERTVALLSEPQGTTPLVIYGFSDFSPLQQAVIEAAIRSRDALAFFPWHEGAAYEAATASLGWLMSLGLQRTALRTKGATHTSLRQLQARLFTPVSFVADEKPQKSDHSVVILSAPTVSREVREIARVIFMLVCERHLRFDDIAVFMPNLAAYGPLFYESLAAFGIPCAFTKGPSLLQTRAGQSVTLLWQVLAEDYARARVLEFLSVARPPFAELLGTLAEYAQLARWDGLSQEAGIVRGADEWRTRLAQLYARNVSDDTEPSSQELTDQQILRACMEFMSTFLADTEPLSHANNWNGWDACLRALLMRYVSPSPYSEQVAAVFTRLEQLNLLDEAVSLREWGRIVTDALAATPAALAPDEPTAKVFVGDLACAQGMQFRVVIIPGMVEGQIPQTVRQDPLLFDSERQHLSETLLCDLRQRNLGVEEDRLAFALAVQSATEYLIFTYARQDQASGRTQVPSVYLLRAVEALSGQPASFTEFKDWSVHVPLSPLWNDQPATALDAIEFHWASVARAQETRNPTVLGYLPTTSPFFSPALTAIHQRWDVPHLTAYDGVLTTDATIAKLNAHLFPERMLLSASALETYARCPFRYFLTSVLGLAPQDDPEQLLTIRPRDRGILLHAILHDFFSRLHREQRLPVRISEQESLRQLLMEVADAHCAAFARAKVTGLRLLWELEQERMQVELSSLLQWEIEREDTFVPVGFEVPFGREEVSLESPFFPTQLVSFVGDESFPVFFHGRIDRIDIASDGQRARILDYKSGKPVRGRFAGGTALQLPLYLFAARHLRPDLDWTAAEYVSLRSHVRKEKPPAFTPETWAGDLETTTALAGSIARGIRSGCFPPTPDSCRPCPFPSICGAQAELHAARKRDDVRLAFLQQVKNTP